MSEALEGFKPRVFEINLFLSGSRISKKPQLDMAILEEILDSVPHKTKHQREDLFNQGGPEALCSEYGTNIGGALESTDWRQWRGVDRNVKKMMDDMFNLHIENGHGPPSHRSSNIQIQVSRSGSDEWKLAYMHRENTAWIHEFMADVASNS
ncbi:hypothetical protein FOL47_007616 [Perkinsus chesapeaki]|uniref:Uncharacterized protein n=1 Tax=Perkinsus chesapeaki TaxID=330153 RepID=A0A7J6LJ76_PERCH|nr:hypothetical protein FOL47_007616 [Perkinsus chesapeaki]